MLRLIGMMSLCPSGVAGADTIANPTAIVLPNKTILLVYRYSTGVKHGAGEALAAFIADRAEGPWHSVSPDLSSLQAEDPALYWTKRGLHLAAHQYNSTYVFPNGTTISVVVPPNTAAIVMARPTIWKCRKPRPFSAS